MASSPELMHVLMPWVTLRHFFFFFFVFFLITGLNSKTATRHAFTNKILSGLASQLRKQLISRPKLVLIKLGKVRDTHKGLFGYCETRGKKKGTKEERVSFLRCLNYIIYYYLLNSIFHL